jgi:hypothetical protein
MKKFILVSLIAIFSISDSLAQKTLSGVTLPEQLGYNKVLLKLNGAGIREKYFMHIYVAGLYVSEVSNNAENLINREDFMSLRIQIISSILTNETMVRYIEDGFARSVGGKETDAFKKMKNQIKTICMLFSSEPTKVGDVYDIHYLPGKGITSSKNGKPFVGWGSDDQPSDSTSSIIYIDLDFKKALFGIWLSEDPVDVALKEGLLGLTPTH